MKKNVSILGCGWLGYELAKSLVKNGFNVKGSTRTPKKINQLESAGIQPYVIDISQNIKKNNAFFESEVIIIAITSKSSNGFERLIEQIESSLIKKVIFISSTSVYPSNNKIVTEESDTLNTALFQIEERFRKNKKIDSTIIRFCGLFGEDRIPSKFHQPGKPIPNPEGYVNLIHRTDCIGIIKEIIAQEVWNETFNGCCNSHPKRRNFYLNQRIKSGIKETIFNEDDANNYKIVSGNKVIEKLNYTFIHSDLFELTTE